jgi:hypothetical protein
MFAGRIGPSHGPRVWDRWIRGSLLPLHISLSRTHTLTHTHTHVNTQSFSHTYTHKHWKMSTVHWKCNATQKIERFQSKYKHAFKRLNFNWKLNNVKRYILWDILKPLICFLTLRFANFLYYSESRLKWPLVIMIYRLMIFSSSHFICHNYLRLLNKIQRTLASF